MKTVKFIYKFLLLLSFAIILTQCARRGRPTGGPKDEKAPILVTAKPPNQQTNFSKKNIRIYFDEYITLRELNKQLIISPPMKNQPIITPQGNPSKYINIKILDTLQQNTTYTFNFGNAIQDNNEGNKLESLIYSFSTGNTIDSLTLKGSVNDALVGKLNQNSSLLLYRLDQNYNDSIVYKRKPDYVAKTLDSVNFKFTNIKEGKYKLLAINETYSDYIFNPKEDKIGFCETTISLPKDSLINNPIQLFKETQNFKFKKAKEISKGKIQFAYTGEKTNLSVKLLTEVPATFKSISFFEKEKDTLNYWFTPIEKDSLNFIVSNNNFIDTVTVQLRKKKIDSVKITSNLKRILHINDTLALISNNPIINFDKTKFSLTDKDSIIIDTKIIKQNSNQLNILFTQKPKKSYKLNILPNAIKDIFNTSNDSLNYSFSTKEIEDYGTIALNVSNKTNNNLIIELLNEDKIIQRKLVKSASNKINFINLQPKQYTIRAIIDANKNEKWDTGILLEKIQPERIIYFPEKIALRANWSVDNNFTVE